MLVFFTVLSMTFCILVGIKCKVDEWFFYFIIFFFHYSEAQYMFVVSTFFFNTLWFCFVNIRVGKWFFFWQYHMKHEAHLMWIFVRVLFVVLLRFFFFISVKGNNVFFLCVCASWNMFVGCGWLHLFILCSIILTFMSVCGKWWASTMDKARAASHTI